MKKLYTGALLLAGALIFCGCAAPDEADEGFLNASPDTGEYVYTYPATWTQVRDDNMCVIEYADTVVDEEGRKIYDRVNISSVTYTLSGEFEDIDDYVNRDTVGYIALMRDTFGEKVEIVEVTDDNLDIVPAKRIVYHIRVGQDEYHFVTVPGINNNVLYDITYTAAGDNFEEHLPTLDNVVKSFKFN